jgi:hypothetical protein
MMWSPVIAFEIRTPSCKPASIFGPHILRIFAGFQLTILLERVALVVVEICRLIAIAIVHAEVKILVKVFPDLTATRVRFKQSTTHVEFL